MTKLMKDFSQRLVFVMKNCTSELSAIDRITRVY